MLLCKKHSVIVLTLCRCDWRVWRIFYRVPFISYSQFNVCDCLHHYPLYLTNSRRSSPLWWFGSTSRIGHALPSFYLVLIVIRALYCFLLWLCSFFVIDDLFYVMFWTCTGKILFPYRFLLSKGTSILKCFQVPTIFSLERIVSYNQLMLRTIFGHIGFEKN